MALKEKDGSDPQPLTPNGCVWFGATSATPAQHWWLGSTSKPVQQLPVNTADHLYYYDLAGNLISSVANDVETRFYYNAQNKLSKIIGTSQGFSYEFGYDSRNRRVAQKKNGGDWRYDLHDGNVCIAHARNGTLEKFFVRSMGIAEGTGDVIAEIDTTGETPVPHYYIANHRGDTVLTLTDSGAVDSFLEYDAFGAVLTNIGTFMPTYTFSTKEPLPELNAMLYAYRIYLIDCARWNQRDPIGYQDSANLYQFCGGNPIAIVDPDGQAAFLAIPSAAALGSTVILYVPPAVVIGVGLCKFTTLSICPERWRNIATTPMFFPWVTFHSEYLYGHLSDPAKWIVDEHEKLHRWPNWRWELYAHKDSIKYTDLILKSGTWIGGRPLTGTEISYLRDLRQNSVDQLKQKMTAKEFEEWSSTHPESQQREEK